MSVAGVFIPAGVGVTPEPVLVGDHTHISEMVGGIFDAVTGVLGEDNVFVGYINDTGAVDGLELNYVATALFQRELHGDCVVVWGSNAEGVYDGENHDIPEAVASWICDGLVRFTASRYNEAVMVQQLLEAAVENGVATQQEVDTLRNDLYGNVTHGDWDGLADAEARLVTLLDRVTEVLSVDDLLDIAAAPLLQNLLMAFGSDDDEMEG